MKEATKENKIWAREVALEVWRHFQANPSLTSKTMLPAEVFEKIRYCENWCSLCDLFYDRFDVENCPGCPLKQCGDNSLFEEWCASPNGSEERSLAAGKIVKVLEEWEI